MTKDDRRRLPAALYAAWFLLGCALWFYFLNGGDIPFDFHDWAEVNAPRLAFVKDAAMKNVFPLHMPDASALRGVSDRYFSLPDVFFTPQLILLKWLSVGQFVLAHFLILYAVGFIGLLRIARKFDLSQAGFAFLFLIYNFNGHLLSHVAVGHVTWGGNLLFSWFILWVYELYEAEPFSWRWPVKMAALLFAIFLQGSFHQFVWCLLFLCAAVLTFWKKPGNLRSLRPDWAKWKAVFFAGLFSVLLSAVRILPTAIQLGGFDDEFLGGYRSLRQLVRAFLTHVLPQDSLNRAATGGNLGWWEYNLYIGAAAAVLLLIFAVARVCAVVRERRFPLILFPGAAIAFLSVADVYGYFRALPLPLFAGERVSSRFLILPFLFIVVEALRSEEGIRARIAGRKTASAALTAGFLLLLGRAGWELLTEARNWRVLEAVRAFPVTPTDLTIKTVANHADPVYTSAIWIGAAATAATAIVMALLYVRGGESRNPADDGGCCY